MPIRYYPASRIKPNLYTRGNEYILPNGKPYTGRYYLTYDGKAFVGINPVLGTNELLSPKPANQNIAAPSNIYTLATSQNQVRYAVPSELELKELTPYYPIPTESDYNRGYFTRYFAKYVTGPQFIVEISQGDYANISNGNVSPTILSYEITEMLWQLTGPKNDTRISQYQIKGGVFDTNKRVTEGKEKTFRGIISYIGGDYTKFARLT